MPEVVEGIHAVHERPRADDDVLEAGVGEQAGELGVVGEAEERRARRYPGRSRGAGPDHGLGEQTGEPAPFGGVPHRERHTPSRHEHAERLDGGDLGTSEVQEHEVAGDRVERGVLERQPVGVTAPELDAGVGEVGESHHLVGHVQPHGRGASSRRGSGNRSRP